MTATNKYRIVGELGIECDGRIVATCPSPADAAVILTLLMGGKAKAARKTRKGAWHWPPPVYVASYVDGHSCRMSFAAPSAKPVSIEAARMQALQHRPVKIHGDANYPMGIPTGEYVAMVAFHVEHNGAIIGGDVDQREAA